ncbi:hypothetical protein JCM19237_5207 [Photobacterium aphoticum]|uniref:Uncharacterized protein n=1 Tax=Photobacterium aphoticum TaxID=754436 RepID=A0A090QKG4_9GAMM|nr:hypothetical protein JCM19237_5207 [Photobacterium aphoticum]
MQHTEYNTQNKKLRQCVKDTYSSQVLCCEYDKSLQQGKTIITLMKAINDKQ